MKAVLLLLILFNFSLLLADDYILEFQANVKIIKEYNISNNEKFRSYELKGTFTDEYGNYGKFEGIVISDVKDAKLIKLEGTAKIIYSNGEIIYLKAYRRKSDFDAGVANAKIIGSSENYKSLIGTKCIQSVRYFEDTIFGLQKCRLSEELAQLLKKS